MALQLRSVSSLCFESDAALALISFSATAGNYLETIFSVVVITTSRDGFRCRVMRTVVAHLDMLSPSVVLQTMVILPIQRPILVCLWCHHADWAEPLAVASSLVHISRVGLSYKRDKTGKPETVSQQDISAVWNHRR